MAEPPPATMTVTIAVPILASIYQSVRDLETEVRNLEATFSTRLEALEAQLARQTTIQSPSDTTIQSPPDTTTDLPQDIADDITLAPEDLGDEDLHVQIDDRSHSDGLAPKDVISHRDDLALTHEEELIHEEGTAMAEPVIPPPTAGHKRKRTVRDAPARINNSGFIFRSSDAQLAEKRSEHAKAPSRSESPFDNNDRPEPSSDVIPAVRPRSPLTLPLPQSQARPRYRES